MLEGDDAILTHSQPRHTSPKVLGTKI